MKQIAMEGSQIQVEITANINHGLLIQIPSQDEEELINVNSMFRLELDARLNEVCDSLWELANKRSGASRECTRRAE